MYYRRKILLSLIELFGGSLGKIQLQKLLLLLCQRQIEPAYHFVPFRYGCFSFQANSDLSTLTKMGLLNESETHWSKIDKSNYSHLLTSSDQHSIDWLKNNYSNYSKDELIKFTYVQYPYYAINSTIANTLLDDDEYLRIQNAVPHSNDSILYTIGYEGISLEEYFNRLIKCSIKVLCDVRNNPISMKYGFSKSQLMRTCSALGIEYVHLPGLGIVSEKRRNLQTQTDYDDIFEQYRNEVLTQNIQDQIEIVELMHSRKRVALTCFEADIHKCHRYHLSNALKNFDDWDFQIKHI